MIYIPLQPQHCIHQGGESIRGFPRDFSETLGESCVCLAMGKHALVPKFSRVAIYTIIYYTLARASSYRGEGDTLANIYGE